MRLLIILIVLISQLNSYAGEKNINLDDDLKFTNLGRQVSYYEDKTSVLTLSQIQALSNSGHFKPGEADILNLGNTKSAFWIRINYSGNAAEKNYLLLDMPNIEHVDFYVETAHKRIHRISGSVMPSSPGASITNKFIFDLPIQQKDVSNTIWLKLKTNNILIVPIKIVNSEVLTQQKLIRNSFEMIYIGILLTLFIFNIFLYFSIKDKTYLYYTLYVFSLGVYVLTYLRGYSYLLGSDVRILLNLHPHAFLSISIIASILFSRDFLNLKNLAPSWVKAYNFLIVCCIIMLLTSLLGFKSISTTLAQSISLLSAIILWSSGVVIYRKGHKPAVYYILAWSFLALTVIAIVLSFANVFPYHDYSSELVPIGSTIELLLLSFALGDRYRTILTNERKVRDENLILIQTQNQRLEKLVEERMIRLTDTIMELESSNSVKNKLFSIIAHDLRSPFNSLMSIFSLKDMNLLSLEELKALLNENKKYIDTIHNTLNNLLYWAMNQMEGITTQPTNFNLKELIDDLNLVYAPLIQSKGITINLKIADQRIVYADDNQIQLVLRNLIDNAIKFTPLSYSIDISTVVKARLLEISVSNTISSTHVPNLESIRNPSAFETTAGTGHEKGIGLGLHLCHEYIKSNGSTLEVKVNEQRIFFRFELPLANPVNTILT